ncbi:MAG: nitronate monooxygenase [Candidatus Marinimicrobia bacterium]|nr:nitronate monooxygenase [Candidatus Neomarinimicrobiota bacterium]
MIRNKFFKTGKEFLGVEFPIICGAMTWVSGPQLVSAVSNAGGFGVLAGGNAPVEILKEQILETQKLTNKPFGVNLITIAPNYSGQLELIAEMNLPFVIFAGSFPKKKEVQIAKESGAKVLCFASTKSIADTMIRYGADALILEGMEAGGHVGHVTTVVLLQQVLFEVSHHIPVFVGGGIGTGKLSAHLLMMGAAGIQLGTRFAVAKESQVHPKFKEKIIKANARDAVSTPQFDSRLPVVAVRAIHNKSHDEFSKLQFNLLRQLDKNEISRYEAQMQVENFWVGSLKNAVINGDIEHGSLMAGQTAGLVTKEQSVREIIEEMIDDIEKEFKDTKEKLFF